MSHPAARMPDVKLTEDEVVDIMGYLKSIADPDFPGREWPAWANKGFEEMADDEFDASLELVEKGRAVWGNARCTICHAVNGPGGERIGGFVDLRVGGIDLMAAGPKLTRDWLYQWIKDPKVYFPDTLMPRYQFPENDLTALVEFILRDDAFQPPLEEEEEQEEDAVNHFEALDDPMRIGRGKDLIELSRCVVCHDIDGISEVLSVPQRPSPPPPGSLEFLVYDLRCLSCHTIEGRGATYAPDLTGEGSRLHEQWIAQFVESPDIIRPLSQQMPKLNLTAEEARIIASYLSTSRHDARIPEDIPGKAVTAKDIQRGREAFQAKGCFSCHTAGEGPGGVVGPDLRTVQERMKPGAIWFHIRNPHAVDPYSAEPDYGLTDDEARGLAAYLSTRKQ
jgi:mono/diheme cytochrome c family protein